MSTAETLKGIAAKQFYSCLGKDLETNIPNRCGVQYTGKMVKKV